MRELPALTGVRVFPLIVATVVVADEYWKDPAIDPATVGAVSVTGAAP